MKSVRQSQACVDRLSARRAGMASHARHVSRMLQFVFNVVLMYKWCVQEFLLRVKLDTAMFTFLISCRVWLYLYKYNGSTTPSPSFSMTSWHRHVTSTTCSFDVDFNVEVYIAGQMYTFCTYVLTKVELECSVSQTQYICCDNDELWYNTEMCVWRPKTRQLTDGL